MAAILSRPQCVKPVRTCEMDIKVKSIEISKCNFADVAIMAYSGKIWKKKYLEKYPGTNKIHFYQELRCFVSSFKLCIRIDMLLRNFRL